MPLLSDPIQPWLLAEIAQCRTRSDNVSIVDDYLRVKRRFSDRRWGALLNRKRHEKPQEQAPLWLQFIPPLLVAYILAAIWDYYFNNNRAYIAKSWVMLGMAGGIYGWLRYQNELKCALLAACIELSMLQYRCFVIRRRARAHCCTICGSQLVKDQHRCFECRTRVL